MNTLMKFLLFPLLGGTLLSAAQDLTPSEQVLTALEKQFAVLGENEKKVRGFLRFEEEHLAKPSIAFQNALTRTYHIALRYPDNAQWAAVAAEMETKAKRFETLSDEFEKWRREARVRLRPISDSTKTSLADLSGILDRFKNEKQDITETGASLYLKEIEKISGQLSDNRQATKTVIDETIALARKLKLPSRFTESVKDQEKIDLKVLRMLADLNDDEDALATCSATCEVGVKVGDNPAHQFAVLTSEVSHTDKSAVVARDQLDSACAKNLKLTIKDDRETILKIGLEQDTVPKKLVVTQFENYHRIFEAEKDPNGLHTLPTLTGSCSLKAVAK